MKLLYITVSMPFGPSEPFFVPEVQDMLRQGCELLIVQRSPSGECTSKDATGLDQQSLPKPLVNAEIITTALSMCIRQPLPTIRALGRLFHSRNLSTFLKNLSVFPKALWIAKLARRWGADHIHAQWGLTTSTMAMVASDISGIPWSCTVHRVDIIGNNLLALKLRRASFVRFISRDGIALAESICGSPLLGKVVLLHLCVDMPTEVVLHDTLRDPPLLICPGALIERKGQCYLIDAIRILHESGMKVNLWLAGEGEMRPTLQALVARHGLQSQVTFLGQVEHTELLDMFRARQVDAVVLPTLHEGIPVALIEPMGYGIPVISTTVGGIPELLRDGAGILVPPHDPAALAEAIERLVRDPALRIQLSAAGRKRIEEEFSVNTVVAKLVAKIEAA